MAKKEEIICLYYYVGENRMSFLVSVYINEGIVLASDRRTTYSNTMTVDGKTIQNIGIHVTNSTDKTFICRNGAGLSYCGEASLLGKPLTGYIQEMIRTKIGEECQIESIPNICIDYFSKYTEVPNTNFIVAGYDIVENNKVQSLIKFNVKSRRIEHINTSSQGAIWDGETFTLSRLLQNVAVKVSDDKYIDLPYEEILWNYFTLQDAIDFARFAVETTINTMRFKNVVETVGGKVDILVITPSETKWIQKELIR